MKNTEAKILEKAKQVMADLDGKYYSESTIGKPFFREKEEVADGQYADTWTVSVESLFDNLDFLTISDETGEPIYYQNFNMIISDIVKSAQGKYILKR